MFRKAEKTDIDAVENIYHEIHKAEKDGITKTGWLDGIYPVRATALAGLDRGDLFVYEENGKILACAVINRIQVDVYEKCEWKYPARDDEVMVLHTLAVLPSAAGKGIGTAFAEFLNCHGTTSHIAGLSGVPTLFINGKPFPAAAYITYLDKYAEYEAFAKAGCRLFSVPLLFAGRWISATDGFRPFRKGFFDEKGKPDFSPFDEAVEKILSACPDAYIIPRLNISMPEWWEKENPDSVNILSDGRTKRESFYSEKWKNDTAGMLEQFLAYVEDHPFAEHIAGWQIAGGNTEEWFHFDLNGGWYDDPDIMNDMEEYFGIYNESLLKEERSFPSEAAVFTDETAYRAVKKHRFRETGRGLLTVLGKTDIPYDIYDLFDFEAVHEKYKAVVFLTGIKTPGLKKAMKLCRKKGIPFIVPSRMKTNFTSGDLRSFFRKNGLKIYCDSDDILYVSGNYAALCALSDGDKKITVPGSGTVIEKYMKRGETELFIL